MDHTEKYRKLTEYGKEAVMLYKKGKINFHGETEIDMLNEAYSAVVEIADRYNLDIDDLTQHNWNKFKPGSERGEEWMKARKSTDYIGGKIGLK